MRERDRLLLIGGVVAAVLVVTWMFWVSPERKSAATAKAAVGAAQTALDTAQSQVATAEASKARYAAAYSAMVSIGKAVPASADVPALIYQLDSATNSHDVVFNSITPGGSSTSSSGSPASSSTVSSGFTALPFTFNFSGTFFDLYHLLGKLNSFAIQRKNGTLNVTGRLLTITGASLSGGTTSSTTSGSASPDLAQTLHGTITADAYVLAPTTAASTATGGTTATTPATGASTTGTPAVIGSNP
jgi:hypothetical protein